MYREDLDFYDGTLVRYEHPHRDGLVNAGSELDSNWYVKFPASWCPIPHL